MKKPRLKLSKNQRLKKKARRFVDPKYLAIFDKMELSIEPFDPSTTPAHARWARLFCPVNATDSEMETINHIIRNNILFKEEFRQKTP